MAQFEVDEVGCWNWTGTCDRDGYGKIKGEPPERRTLAAHRVSYELLVGPTSETIDHLCRNRRCVNPSHLEATSLRDNILRGESFSAKNARKTHCDNGHLLSGENLRIRADGSRRCRSCQKVYSARYQAKKRAQAA